MIETLFLIVTELIRNITSFIWDFLNFTFAPVILFVLMLISGSILHDDSVYKLSAVINVICTIGMVVSFVRCQNEFGNKGKVIVLVLCIVSAVISYSDVKNLEDAPISSNAAHSNISFTGKNTKCSGCFGRGYIFCQASNCSNGRCTACTYGSFNHGTYRSDCRVCGGDGICNRCNGSNKVACKVCD